MSLSAFSSKAGGIYGKLFNHEGEKAVSENPFIVFDVKNIATDPLLYAVINVSLINLIIEKVYGRRHIKKHILFDESSELFDKDLGELIRVLYREIRKENGDIGVIVQLITDLSDTANGAVVIDNAKRKILLDHKLATKSVPMVKEVLDMDDHNFELFKSLNAVPADEGREIFWYENNVGKVFRLVVPEELRIAFSTDSNDTKIIRDLMKKYSNPRIAIKEHIASLKKKKTS